MKTSVMPESSKSELIGASIGLDNLEINIQCVKLSTDEWVCEETNKGKCD